MLFQICFSINKCLEVLVDKALALSNPSGSKVIHHFSQANSSGQEQHQMITLTMVAITELLIPN